MDMTLYLFDPQLVCLETIPNPVELWHKEASYQAIARFKTDFRATTGYCIGFKCIDGKFRIFEIDEIDYRDETGDCYCTATDRAVLELTDIVAEDIHCDGMTALAAVQNLIDRTSAPWVIGDTVTTQGATTRHYYTSLWSCFQKIMTVYGVRIVPWYDFNTVTNAITRRVVDVVSAAPVYRGRLIESGDGANNVVVQITGSPKTAIYGRGKGEEIGESQSGDPTYGRRITFKDVVWVKAQGYPADKPKGQEWVGDTDALALYGRNGRHRFDVVIFEDQTDPEQLLWDTWNYLQTVAYPTITATATLHDLEMLEGYTYAAVRVGDEVIIRPKQYPDDFRSTIMEIERNYIWPDETRITISNGTLKSAGSVITGIQSKVSTVADEVNQTLGNVITRDSIIDTMETKIMSSGTKMYTDETSGAFIFESTDGQSAMMLTGAGWMIADSKTGTAWNWRTAATGEGIVADTVTTGILQASLVKIFGSDHFLWDAENIYIREAVFKDIAIQNLRYQTGTDTTVTDGTVLVYQQMWRADDYVNVLATNLEAGTYTFSMSHFVWYQDVQYTGYIWLRWLDNGVEHWQQMEQTSRNYSFSITFQSDGTAENPNEIRIGLPILDKAPVYILELHLVRDSYIRTVWSNPVIISNALPCSLGYTSVLPGLSAGKYRLLYDGITPDSEAFTLIAQDGSGNDTEIEKISNTTLQIDFMLTAQQSIYVLGQTNLREIRIGKYDGEHYGIGYTEDGGVTWETALDFNGLNVSGEAISLRTNGGYVDIREGTFNAYAGSFVNFFTNNFNVRNASGRNLISISADQNTEGQVVLGEDGFPVAFGGGFILPVKNGGTGYDHGQVHHIRNIPAASFGEDGDLAIYYAGADTSYSDIAITVTQSASFAESNKTVAGILRRWNNCNAINSGVPAGYWAVGNDAGYPYAVFGDFTAPVDIAGGISLQMTITKYVGGSYYGKANGTTLQVRLCSTDGATTYAETTFTTPDREAQTVTVTLNTSQTLLEDESYRILIYDLSDQVTWSYSLIQMNTLIVPGFSGGSTYGLYVKSAGSWHEIGGATNAS